MQSCYFNALYSFRVGRKIVTKNPTRDDDEGDSDMLEITHEYKTTENSAAEKLSVFNACRGFQRAQQYYDFPNREMEDVFFDLVDIDMVPFGQPFDVVVNIHVSNIFKYSPNNDSPNNLFKFSIEQIP